jgi:5-methyltetrahydrofolate--homocysteine methyltransferase
MAEKSSELLEMGVQIIGGCCGTSPDHIRALRKAVDDYRK